MGSPPRVEIVGAEFLEHRPSRRDRVYEAVRRGRITPERAEEWARENREAILADDPCLDPTELIFAKEADPAGFDPMGEKHWTLAMATAWALWRTASGVREAWAPFLMECRRWKPIDVIVARPGGLVRFCGHELREPKPPNAADILERARDDKAGLVLSADEVDQAMRSGLRNGKLKATGGDQAGSIAASLWTDLSPFARPARRGQHDAIYVDRGELRFGRVLVEREAVVALWPALPLPALPIRMGRRSVQDLWLPRYDRQQKLGLNGRTKPTAVSMREWLRQEVEAGRVTLPGKTQIPALDTFQRIIRKRRKLERGGQ